MGADHADAGQAMPGELIARPAVKYHKFPSSTRQLSLRNTGVNTLWLSFDRKHWYDVACGTSWDDRVNALGFWYCTQIGVTAFVINGLALNPMTQDAFKVPEPTEEERAL